MNKIYRLIWDAQNNAFVAVSENTKAKGKKSSKTLLAMALVSSLGIFVTNSAMAACNPLAIFSFDNVVLPSIFFKKLAFLENYGIKFDEVTRSISGGSDLLNLTLVSMIIVFFFKNSMQLKDKFKSNIFILVFTVFLFVYSMFSLNKFSEFLYFNF